MTPTHGWLNAIWLNHYHTFGNLIDLTHQTILKSAFTLPEVAAAAKSLQLCPTLCNPGDRSPPGSPVPGILQQEHWIGLPFPSPMHESEK